MVLYLILRVLFSYCLILSLRAYMIFFWFLNLNAVMINLSLDIEENEMIVIIKEAI
jgi:hypothetical protein